jgi:hypothetical protein
MAGCREHNLEAEAERRLGSSPINGDENRMICLRSGENQAGANIVLLEIRKIAQHFGLAYTGGEKIENILHPDTHYRGCKGGRRTGSD